MTFRCSILSSMHKWSVPNCTIRLDFPTLHNFLLFPFAGRQYEVMAMNLVLPINPLNTRAYPNTMFQWQASPSGHCTGYPSSHRPSLPQLLSSPHQPVRTSRLFRHASMLHSASATSMLPSITAICCQSPALSSATDGHPVSVIRTGFSPQT